MYGIKQPHGVREFDSRLFLKKKGSIHWGGKKISKIHTNITGIQCTFSKNRNVRSVMAVVVGNGHRVTSSKPGDG